MITSPTDYMNEVKAKKQVVGTWGFNSHMDFTKTSSEENNVWVFEQVFNFLRSFFGLVMPDNMEVITYNATKHIKKKGLDQQTFLDELMLVMKGLKEPIWTFRLNLNIVGFIRSHADPDNPVRVQIQEPSSFIVWAGPDETGFQNFSISYNLFNESALMGSDEMLWSVNQPLLEKGLRKWEMQSGRMIESVQGNSASRGGMATRYGFKKPLRRRTGARPTGAPNPTSGARPRPGATDPSMRPAPGARPAEKVGVKPSVPKGTSEIPLGLDLGDPNAPSPLKKRRITRKPENK